MQARSGEARQALQTLQRLLKQDPSNARLLADATIVANWAGEDALALDLYNRSATPGDDGGVVEAAARSARNLHQYPLSEGLFRKAQKLSPDRWQPRLGEALVLVDSGNNTGAEEILRVLLQTHPDERDILSGEIYLCSRKGNNPCVLAMDERILAQQPKNEDARCQMAATLSAMGGATQALKLPCTQGSTARSLTQQANYAAEHIHWGESYSPRFAQHNAESEEALKHLDAVIAAAPAQSATWRTVQFDRLVVLYDLRRNRDVIAEYEKLHAANIPVPNYALQSVAAAYLALRHPAESEKIYRQVLKQDPKNLDTKGSLAYAQFEQEHIYQSFQTIDGAWAGTRQATPAYVALGGQATAMRGYAELLSDAWKRQTALLSLAPANVSLRLDLATTALARGWTHTALTESRIAEEYADTDDTPSLESAEIRESAALRDQVDAILPVLEARDGNSPALERFERGMRFNRGWAFDATSGYEWGSGVQVGSTEDHSEAHLYSPLFDDRFRVYVHELRDAGVFLSQPEARTRDGLGFKYDYNRRTAWLETAYDLGSNRFAVNAGAQAAWGDHWAAHIEGDTDSFEVSPRALTQNIRGRSIDAGIDWHQNELRSGGVSLSHVLFTDGNQRWALPAAWSQRIYTAPRLEATLRIEEWTSRNSQNEDRPYFNPASDFSLGPDATIEWLTWRRYEHSFRQVLSIAPAPYWQQNYGTGGVLALRYEQNWQIRDGVDLRWGASWNTHPYDGTNEYTTGIDAGIRWGNQ